MFSKRALSSLIAANLVTFFGVIFFGWSLSNIVFIYWAEIGVIGFYTALKLLKVNYKSHLPKIAEFFLAYNVFLFGIGVVLMFAFTDSFNKNLLTSNLFAIASLFVSHGISYYANYLKSKEYISLSVDDIIERATLRILAMFFFASLIPFVVEFNDSTP